MPETSETTPESNYKERPLLFMLLLGLVIFFNFILGILAIVFTPSLPTMYQSRAWSFYLAGILAFLNVIFGIFLFRWKKWAFYGLCVSSVIAFIINLAIGTNILNSLFGFLLPVILYLTIRSKWKLLE